MVEISMNCTACGKENLRKEDLGYTHPELVAYCKSPANCNAAHPNSLENTIRRGYQIPLTAYTQAVLEVKAKTLLDGDVSAENIEAYELLNKPIGTRIQSMETARMIVRMKKELGLTTSRAVSLLMDKFREYVETGVISLGAPKTEEAVKHASVVKESQTSQPTQSTEDEF